MGIEVLKIGLLMKCSFNKKTVLIVLIRLNWDKSLLRNSIILLLVIVGTTDLKIT